MSCRGTLVALMFFCCLSALAQDMGAMHHMQMQPTITGKEIPVTTARQLYLLSLSNLDHTTLSHYFRLNLGWGPTDVTAASKVIRDFGIRYNEASKTYNEAIGEDGSRFTEALSHDLDANQALA